MAVPTGQADLNAAEEARSGDGDGDVREFFTELIATIDVNLLGPDDDGEEAAQYFYLRAIERAHDFAVKQPCECTFETNGSPDEVCERCRVIGCSLTDHRENAGCRRFVTTDEQVALLNRIHETIRAARIADSPVKRWKLTHDQLHVMAWPYTSQQFLGIHPTVYGIPVDIVATEAESSLA